MQVLKIVWVHCSMVRVNLIFKRDLGAILIWQPKERRYVAVINTDFVIEVLQTLSKNTTATATIRTVALQVRFKTLYVS